VQRAGELGSDWDVMASVGAECLPGRGMMIAEHRRVELHDQSVVARHPGHLAQHVLAEGGGFGVGRAASERGGVDPLGRRAA
jgi:hypothetical protein